MEKLRIEQACAMMQLQADMNAVVNAEWLNAGYPFLRAVVVEAAEAMEHVGWKWWKQQDQQLDQVRIELIDILHFYLSAALVNSNGSQDIAVASFVNSSCAGSEIQFDASEYALADLGLLELLELLAGLAASNRLELTVLEHCFAHCAVTWDDVFKIYVSKNVLNIFRQRNGYKDGSYRKMWDGEEDNVYLAHVMCQLDSASVSYTSDLYNSLTEKYKAVLAAQ